MREGQAVERLKQGDISGLETLVQLHQNEALDVAYLITHDHTMAEDVVQEAFLRAYRHIHTFDDKRPFGPWFLRIVANMALTIMGKITARTEVSLHAGSEAGMALEEHALLYDQVPDLEPGLSELLEAAETREEIVSTLRRLSPGQRAAVVMRYYFDWSDEEMSQALGIAPGTVRWRLNRAREQLRRLLPSWVTHPEKGEAGHD